MLTFQQLPLHSVFILPDDESDNIVLYRKNSPTSAFVSGAFVGGEPADGEEYRSSTLKWIFGSSCPTDMKPDTRVKEIYTRHYATS